jgi:hypothetical protein
MSSDPKPKFINANLTYDGVIEKGLLSKNEEGQYIPKGKRLREYIEVLPLNKRPSHIFFTDDQLFSDPYLEWKNRIN